MAAAPGEGLLGDGGTLWLEVLDPVEYLRLLEVEVLGDEEVGGKLRDVVLPEGVDFRVARALERRALLVSGAALPAEDPLSRDAEVDERAVPLRVPGAAADGAGEIEAGERIEDLNLVPDLLESFLVAGEFLEDSEEALEGEVRVEHDLVRRVVLAKPLVPEEPSEPDEAPLSEGAEADLASLLLVEAVDLSGVYEDEHGPGPEPLVRVQVALLEFQAKAPEEFLAEVHLEEGLLAHLL